MRKSILLASIAGAAVAAAVACGGSSSDVGDATDGADGGGDENSSTTVPESTGAAGTGLATGLPCDVQAVLENRCIACHDGKTQFALLTYDDLVAPSKTDPAKSMAQVALERMKATTNPMPPPPAVPPEADEIQTFEDWVNAGTPKGAACTDPPPDGGAAGDGGATDVGDAAVACTSGKTWDAGDQGSGLMHPGAACNACHQVKGGPNLRIAGTVFPSAHEPNDCFGAPPPVTVTITDAKGKVTTMPVNEAGNFYARARITVPYHAEISSGGKTRKMVGSVTSGDCNGCHTQAGMNGAPGRVMAP